MNLVIVESPTKAKTISKFLGKEYQVESSYGHIRDLPKSKLGIDVENNFEPQYIIPTKARKTVSHLREAASKADVVVLATDEDREGEAIGWHLAQALKLDTKNTKRIVFHEITKSAIEHALKKPRVLDMNLVDAQQARRILDRLVGYKLSPFLWKKVMRGLSAGRVQSVTVRLIVDREIEIRSFKPQEYWTITVELSKNGEALEANLIKINDRILDKFEIANQETAEKITKDLEGKQFMVEKMEQTEFKKNPPPPFITSTLQQDAARRLGFSSKKTMFIAQRLYEHGLITYMRTDSVNLSKDSLTAAQEWLEKEFGKEYSSPRQYESKSRLAQEAHEAVRPTDIEKKPEDLPDETDKKLYRLIWQRFLASQMSPARVATTVIDVKAEEYGLRASGQRILFDGFLKVWTQKVTEKTLPAVDNGEQLDFKKIDPSQHFTEPPPRYSEATLIKALEEH
ncbi:MAG: type I DNA topoisomerase, partial [Patescibacteria group bacterium]